MIHETFTNGVLRERRDDTARTVTTYGPTGQVTSTRPYTTAENAAADAAEAADAERAAAEAKAATRHAEAWYVATVLATAAASWALLTIARALTAATKETP